MVEWHQKQYQLRLYNYSQAPKLCKNCNTELPYNKRVNKFCCHSLTSTYGALNKDNGRKKRYKAKIFDNKSGVGLEDLGL